MLGRKQTELDQRMGISVLLSDYRKLNQPDLAKVHLEKFQATSKNNTEVSRGVPSVPRINRSPDSHEVEDARSTPR